MSIENNTIAIRSIDDIIYAIYVNVYKELDDKDSFFLFCEIPRLEAYSYLFPRQNNGNTSVEDIRDINFSASFTYELEKFVGDFIELEIFSELEISQIASTAVCQKRILDLLEIIIKLTKRQNLLRLKEDSDRSNPYKCLCEIIRTINKGDRKYNNFGPELSYNVIKVLLLCFPQTKLNKIISNNNADSLAVHYSTIKEKIDQIKLLFKWLEGKSMPLKDALNSLIKLDKCTLSYDNKDYEITLDTLEDDKRILEINNITQSKNVIKKRISIISINNVSLDNSEIEIHEFTIKKELNFQERVFLYTSIVEGLLWNQQKFNNEKGSYSWVNLYDYLSNSDNKEYNKKVSQNAFYLKLINFYTLLPDRIEKEIISKIIYRNLDEFILLANSYFQKLNKIESQYFKELLSCYTPKSIIHGLINIFRPENIYVGIDKENNGLCIEKYYFNKETIGLESYINPWARYINIRKDKEKLKLPDNILQDDFKNNGIKINKDQGYILINTNYFNSQLHPIILDLSVNSSEIQNGLLEEKQKNRIISELDNHPFLLKKLVENFALINNSVNYNLNSSEWYNKAFCELYKEFDEIRHSNGENDDQKENNIENHFLYRDWEFTYFSNLIGKMKVVKQDGLYKIVFYDMGVGYGRFEEGLIKKGFDFNNIKLFGFDISRYLIDEIYKDDTLKKVFQGIYICDFQYINSIPDFTIEEGKRNNPDIILFNYTTFGYYKKDEFNENVLIRALEILNDGGSLIIEQFNPNNAPPHVLKKEPEPFDSKSKILIKTSNYSENKDEMVTRYYGNYFYFDTTNNQEKLIKCDYYDIKLYWKEWFIKVIKANRLKLESFNFYSSEISVNDQEYQTFEYDPFDSYSRSKKTQIIIRIEKLNKEEQDKKLKNAELIDEIYLKIQTPIFDKYKLDFEKFKDNLKKRRDIRELLIKNTKEKDLYETDIYAEKIYNAIKQKPTIEKFLMKK